ncbi:MAG: Uma2 family endonuclease [Saprospiraceae bacterium]|nr:Uma2 family endonuclease [Saprospiraceae bacterium]
MEAIVPKQPVQPKPRARKASVHRRKIDTIEKFREWRPRDGFKYEWNNGVIEKLPKMITFKNLYIIERLEDFFQTLKPVLPKRGMLFTEPESMTSPTQLRIPDMAYYTARQIKEGAEGKTPTVPEFIIEFVSNFDQHPKVLEKLEEYFNAGVRVAWLVIPQVKAVYVYTSPVEVTICKGKRICSAEPVVPGFKISADALFS